MVPITACTTDTSITLMAEVKDHCVFQPFEMYIYMFDRYIYISTCKYTAKVNEVYNKLALGNFTKLYITIKQVTFIDHPMKASSPFPGQ